MWTFTGCNLTRIQLFFIQRATISIWQLFSLGDLLEMCICYGYLNRIIINYEEEWSFTETPQPHVPPLNSPITWEERWDRDVRGENLYITTPPTWDRTWHNLNTLFSPYVNPPHPLKLLFLLIFFTFYQAIIITSLSLCSLVRNGLSSISWGSCPRILCNTPSHLRTPRCSSLCCHDQPALLDHGTEDTCELSKVPPTQMQNTPSNIKSLTPEVLNALKLL